MVKIETEDRWLFEWWVENRERCRSLEANACIEGIGSLKIQINKILLKFILFNKIKTVKGTHGCSENEYCEPKIYTESNYASNAWECIPKKSQCLKGREKNPN